MENQNPWWSDDIDINYEEWLFSEIKWIPDIINKIKLKPFSLNFLSGPRQVGKTTAIKILIHQLIKKMQPKSIFLLFSKSKQYILLFELKKISFLDSDITICSIFIFNPYFQILFIFTLLSHQYQNRVLDN